MSLPNTHPPTVNPNTLTVCHLTHSLSLRIHSLIRREAARVRLPRLPLIQPSLYTSRPPSPRIRLSPRLSPSPLSRPSLAPPSPLAASPSLAPSSPLPLSPLYPPKAARSPMSRSFSTHPSSFVCASHPPPPAPPRPPNPRPAVPAPPSSHHVTRRLAAREGRRRMRRAPPAAANLRGPGARAREAQLGQMGLSADHEIGRDMGRDTAPADLQVQVCIGHSMAGTWLRACRARPQASPADPGQATGAAAMGLTRACRRPGPAEPRRLNGRAVCLRRSTAIKIKDAPTRVAGVQAADKSCAG
jgi:hypothetical protein